jgi:hypothetical protein
MCFIRIGGCIRSLITNEEWFLRKMFRTSEYSRLLPIIGMLW